MVRMLNYWFSSIDDICQTTTSFPGSSCRTSVAVRSGRCICTVTCFIVVYVHCAVLGQCDMPVVVMTGHVVLTCTKLRRSPQLQFMS